MNNETAETIFPTNSHKQFFKHIQNITLYTFNLFLRNPLIYLRYLKCFNLKK